MKKRAYKKAALKGKVQKKIRKIRVLNNKSPRKRSNLPKSTITKKIVKKIHPRKVAISLKTKDVPALGTKEKVEVHKFAAVGIIEEATIKHALPYRYNDNRIVLLPRDPWWIHSYWDISSDKVDDVISKIPVHEKEGLTWILRVYDASGIGNFNGDNANSYFDIEINFEANNWYINVANPGREWCVEIGLRTRRGAFYMCARSNIIRTPYFGISDVVDEEWALPDEEYFKLLGIYDLGKSSLERRKKLEQILQGQISSGAFSGGISSLFSLRERKKERKFFLQVATELILYGRTEPGATVSVCGRKIKISDDGTFSLRYALPEGDFRFDVISTSQDELDTITITPAVKRHTIK